MNWYQRDISEVWPSLQTAPEGLSSAAAGQLLLKHGPNRLPEEKGASPFLILLHQFASPLIYILLISAVVTAFLGEYIDMGVIIAVLILNAVIGFIQE